MTIALVAEALTAVRVRIRAFASVSSVAIIGAALVGAFDGVLSARVRAHTDTALRLSVLLPYVGVGSRYVMARACGLTALVTSAAAVALGLELGSRRFQRRGQGSGLRTLHRHLSMATIVLVTMHVVLPYTSSVAPFGGWPTALVPFDQPYAWGPRGRVFESFGIVAGYLFLLLGPTYYLLRKRRRLWEALHSLTIAAYGLAVVHALFLGSDFVMRSATRVVLLAVQIPITVSLARRAAAIHRPGRRPLFVAAAGLSALLVALCAAAVAGVGLGALKI